MMAEEFATIGLIAGNGTFPLLFARAARTRGIRTIAVAMRGETEPTLQSAVDDLTWIRVGQIGRAIAVFRRAGVRRAAMAGGLRRANLFNIRPDWLGLRLLARNLVRPDDGMLRLIAHEFEQRGIEIVDSTLFMPEVLAPAGVLVGREPDGQGWADLRYGYQVARELGRLDVGQTVVVKSGAVVALEAIEGTDACISRAGDLAGGGMVVIKIAKPNQDMRFDVPAIGPKTIDTLARAQCRLLGIEAGRTLVLETQQTLAAASAAGITIVGLEETA